MSLEEFMTNVIKADELVTIHLKVSRDEHDALQRMAEQDLSSIQRVLRVMVRQAIRQLRSAS